MGKINWTQEAEKWMREIYYYIAEDSKDTAKKIINAIYKRVEVLEKFPLLGQRLLDWKNRNIRMLLYGHYRIVYLIKEDDSIDILGVFHGALELEKYLPKK